MKKMYISLVVFLGILMCNSVSVMAWSFPLDISPIAMKFNHGYSDSAINIRVNASTDLTVPEYDTGNSRNNKFAYLVNATPHVLVKFFANPPDPSQTLTIDALAINGLTTWDLADKEMSFNGSGFSVTDPSYSTETNFQMFSSDSALPSSVNINTLMWSWRVVAVGGTPRTPYYMGSTTNYFYTLLDTPQSPISEAWTDLLNFSCNWASGATTTQSAATGITSGLYDSGFTYKSSDGGSMYGDPFSLTTFLADIGTYNYVNCFDMARAVVCFSNSIGCNLSVIRLGRYSEGENRINHPVNCVDPIGTHDPNGLTPPGPTNNPIGSVNQILLDDRTLEGGGFQFHAYAVDPNGYVWDATLKYDTGSDPDHVTGSDPGPGTISYPTPIWTLPANVLESTYRSNLLDSFPEWSATSPTRQSILFNIQ